MSEIKIPPIEPNSYKYRNEKKNNPELSSQTPEKLTPVVSKENLVLPKEGFGSKVKNLFFSNTPKNLGETIIKECFVPAVMKVLWDSIQISLFGKRTDFNWYPDSRYRDYTRSYPTPYRNNDYSRTSYRNDTSNRSGIDWRNLVLRTNEDAERIVHSMWDCIRRNGEVSIAQLLDLFNSVGEFTDNNWGWTDERDIGIRTLSDGYLIDLAEPKYLK